MDRLTLPPIFVVDIGGRLGGGSITLNYLYFFIRQTIQLIGQRVDLLIDLLYTTTHGCVQKQTWI